MGRRKKINKDFIMKDNFSIEKDKNKYIPNPKYKIEEYCDTYAMYNKDDTTNDSLLLTFNPTYRMIYAKLNVEDEAIKEMVAFIKSKNYRSYNVTYSKGDNRR